MGERVGHTVEYGIEHVHVTLTVYRKIRLENVNELAEVHVCVGGTQMMYDSSCEAVHQSCSCWGGDWDFRLDAHK